MGKHMTLPLSVWTEGGRTQRDQEAGRHGTARHGTGRGRAEHRAASGGSSSSSRSVWRYLELEEDAGTSLVRR